jgi:integration host factor subunit beta
LGLTASVVKEAIQNLFDGIIDILVAEGRIELRNFGVFEAITRKPRQARNPRTGETVMVPERKMIRFKPGLEMAEKAEQLKPVSRGKK